MTFKRGHDLLVWMIDEVDPAAKTTTCITAALDLKLFLLMVMKYII